MVFGVFLLWMVIWVGGFALWIWAIVDVARTPDHAFGMTGREKVNWILVVVLVQIIGALIWRFSSARDQIKAAAAANPYAPPMLGPPPGWYPDPSGAPGAVWWDGRTWTGFRQGPPSGSPYPPAPPSGRSDTGW